MSCQKCIDRWGQEPSAWGDSTLELNAWDYHVRFHIDGEDEVEFLTEQLKKISEVMSQYRIAAAKLRRMKNGSRDGQMDEYYWNQEADHYDQYTDDLEEAFEFRWNY